MKILKETEETIVNMTCDFEDDEYKLLLDMAEREMPEERLNELKIEWALTEVLKRAIERAESLKVTE